MSPRDRHEDGTRSGERGERWTASRVTEWMKLAYHISRLSSGSSRFVSHSSPFFRLVCSSPSEPEARMSGGTKERSERRSVAGTLVTTSVSLSSTRYIFASRVPASPFPPYRREKWVRWSDKRSETKNRVNERPTGKRKRATVRHERPVTYSARFVHPTHLSHLLVSLYSFREPKAVRGEEVKDERPNLEPTRGADRPWGRNCRWTLLTQLTDRF